MINQLKKIKKYEKILTDNIANVPGTVPVLMIYQYLDDEYHCNRFFKDDKELILDYNRQIGNSIKEGYYETSRSIEAYIMFLYQQPDLRYCYLNNIEKQYPVEKQIVEILNKRFENQLTFKVTQELVENTYDVYRRILFVTIIWLSCRYDSDDIVQALKMTGNRFVFTEEAKKKGPSKWVDALKEAFDIIWEESKKFKLDNFCSFFDNDDISIKRKGNNAFNNFYDELVESISMYVEDKYNLKSFKNSVRILMKICLSIRLAEDKDEKSLLQLF